MRKIAGRFGCEIRCEATGDPAMAIPAFMERRQRLSAFRRI